MCMIKKSVQKFNMVLNLLGDSYSNDEFVNLFIELFPVDWKLIQDRYEEHARKSKGKWHPMPKPRQYVLNVSHKVRNGII